MTTLEITWAFRLFLCVLTCYRLAKFISEDDGPGFIFERLRVWAKDKAWLEAETNKAIVYYDNPGGEIDKRWYGKRYSLSEGLSCPYCVGLWLSFPLFLMFLFPTQVGDLFLLLMSISAGQAYLQSQKR